MGPLIFITTLRKLTACKCDLCCKRLCPNFRLPERQILSEVSLDGKGFPKSRFASVRLFKVNLTDRSDVQSMFKVLITGTVQEMLEIEVDGQTPWGRQTLFRKRNHQSHLRIPLAFAKDDKGQENLHARKG